MRGLLIAGVLIALGLGFLIGLGTGVLVLGDSAEATADSNTSRSTATSDVPSSAPLSSPSATPSDEPPDATGSAAPPDPEPPGPQGEPAYLARLQDLGLPVEEHRDALLVLGRGLCQAPPEVQKNYAAAGARITAVVGDLLSREQAEQLAELAVTELC